MSRIDQHLTDSELLAAADGELRSRQTRVESHLARCQTCRARMEQIENTMARVAHAYRDAVEPSLPPAAASRAALYSHLAADGEARQARRLQDLAATFRAPAWAYVAGVLLLGAVWFALRHQANRPAGTSEIASAYEAGPLIPDANLTPGAVGAVTASQVCTADSPAEQRPPLAVQQAVFHEYGIDGAPARGYEVDHLITPGLGGTDDIRNLWPESYSTEWNAHVKDELEDRLHNLVCEGRLDLRTAQHDMATNWISAYKKYFHTDKPLLHNSDVVADRKESPNS